MPTTTGTAALARSGELLDRLTALCDTPLESFRVSTPAGEHHTGCGNGDAATLFDLLWTPIPCNHGDDELRTRSLNALYGRTNDIETLKSAYGHIAVLDAPTTPPMLDLLNESELRLLHARTHTRRLDEPVLAEILATAVDAAAALRAAIFDLHDVGETPIASWALSCLQESISSAGPHSPKVSDTPAAHSCVVYAYPVTTGTLAPSTVRVPAAQMSQQLLDAVAETAHDLGRLGPKMKLTPERVGAHLQAAVATLL